MATDDQPTRRLIVIPAHNEERNITPVLTELPTGLYGCGYPGD